MIKLITNCFRIKTEPLNWIVQIYNGKRWNNDAYLERMNQAKNYIMNAEKKELKPLIFNKFEELVKELGLTSTDELSAWHLTKITKHPEFSKTMSDKSLKNLKHRKAPIEAKTIKDRKTTENPVSSIKIEILPIKTSQNDD